MCRDRILVDTLGPGSRNERRNLSGEPFPCHPGVVGVPLGDGVDGFPNGRNRQVGVGDCPLARGGHCAFLPGFVLRPIPKP